MYEVSFQKKVYSNFTSYKYEISDQLKYTFFLNEIVYFLRCKILLKKINAF